MPSNASHTCFWKYVPRISSGTVKAFLLWEKYSFNSFSVRSSIGCVGFSTRSARRTRRGRSFSHRIATSPSSLATSLSFPMGEGMSLYDRLICASFRYVQLSLQLRQTNNFDDQIERDGAAR